MCPSEVGQVDQNLRSDAGGGGGGSYVLAFQ